MQNHGQQDSNGTGNAEMAQLQATLSRMIALHKQQVPSSAADRIARLDACIAYIKANQDALVEAISADFGHRPPAMSMMFDLLGPISSIQYSRKHVKQWMRTSHRKVGFPYNLSGAKARVEYFPKGVVGILGTWNAPMYTLFSPLAQVLAAGNRAIIKPSDLTPNLARVIADTLPNYLDPDWVAVATGGLEVSQYFSTLPFNHIVLTGGTAVGKAVMRAASDHLTPVTLELGGKSPVIVSRSADLDEAADKIMSFKATNSGQICVSPDYVMVPEGQEDAFIDACRRAYRSTFENSLCEAASVINERHFQRVQGYLDDARQRGAELIPLADGGNASSRHLPITVVRNPAADSLLAQNEIFGPAMIVHSYRAIDEVIDRINAGENPLALYYFGHDKAELRHILDRTLSGGVTVNQIGRHPAVYDAPFGGVGASGLGHYHGFEGFQEFSHARTIYTQGWFDVDKLFGLRPPFNDKLKERLKGPLKP